MPGRSRLGPSARCDRARECSSRAVDGDLSDLERRMLDRHLQACAECAAFDARIRATTALLRAAPAEVPSRPFVVPARPAIALPGRRPLAVLLAAALALGALLGSLQRGAGERPSDVPPEVSFLTRDVVQLRKLPRTPPNEVRDRPPPEAAV